MKRLMCTALGGRIVYTEVKDDGQGNLTAIGEETEISNIDFVACMVGFLESRNNEILVKNDRYDFKITLSGKTK